MLSMRNSKVWIKGEKKSQKTGHNTCMGYQGYGSEEKGDKNYFWTG